MSNDNVVKFERKTVPCSTLGCPAAATTTLVCAHAELTLGGFSAGETITKHFCEACAPKEEPFRLISDEPHEPQAGFLGFDDMEAAFNLRGWLQKALEVAGGKMTGGSIGGGKAEVWVELEGRTYEVTIKPVVL